MWRGVDKSKGEEQEPKRVGLLKRSNERKEDERINF